ncbi:FAH family protein [Oesophagostomum dentatum]|uniref:oxaloacetate tautomerase n=1 Tax=Oesophagostomum dentatum TaxID=61180 RepID=A0A0B1T9G6_OESDE|nr:FAH family protein [Oesophagostomum dentatum]
MERELQRWGSVLKDILKKDPMVWCIGERLLRTPARLVKVAKLSKEIEKKFIALSPIPDPHAEELFCIINGVEKQRCKTDVMIFDIPTLIEYTTRFVTLEEGDLILTGTPAGVSRVLPGDCIEFGLTDRVTCKFVVQ